MPATRKQLQHMVLDLRAELGQSLDVNHGVQNDEILKYHLRRTQQELYTFYDWEKTNDYTSIEIHKNMRWYDYPQDPFPINFNDINEMWVAYGNTWTPLAYGVTPVHYSSRNPTGEENSWPPTNWRHSGSRDQFELWPIPSQDGELLVEARIGLTDLVENEDYSTLDATMIVLATAGQLLDENGDPRAPAVQNRATQYITRLLNQQMTDKIAPYVFGGSSGQHLYKQTHDGLRWVRRGTGI